MYHYQILSSQGKLAVGWHTKLALRTLQRTGNEQAFSGIADIREVCLELVADT
jgi:hypothetical protein